MKTMMKTIMKTWMKTRIKTRMKTRMKTKMKTRMWKTLHRRSESSNSSRRSLEVLGPPGTSSGLLPAPVFDVTAGNSEPGADRCLPAFAPSADRPP